MSKSRSICSALGKGINDTIRGLAGGSAGEAFIQDKGVWGLGPPLYWTGYSRTLPFSASQPTSSDVYL